GPALALGGQACQRRPRPDGVLIMPIAHQAQDRSGTEHSARDPAEAIVRRPGRQRGLAVSPSAAAASVPAWRTVNARKIWENPRNNAKNPTQNKIRYVRCANANTRS